MLIKILIIESNEFVRMGMCTLIESSSLFQLVGAADNIDTAYDMAVKNMPDVILYDLLLSNSKFPEYVGRILRACPESKLLALSSDGDLQLQMEVLRFGASGVFVKHQSAELLLKAIQVVKNGRIWVGEEITQKLWQNQISIPTDTVKKNQHFLSVRECSVACLASKGFAAKEIGEQIFVSEKTVRNQLTAVYRKLGVKNHVELCLRSSQLNFCKLPDESRDRDKCPDKKG